MSDNESVEGVVEGLAWRSKDGMDHGVDRKDAEDAGDGEVARHRRPPVLHTHSHTATQSHSTQSHSTQSHSTQPCLVEGVEDGALGPLCRVCHHLPKLCQSTVKFISEKHFTFLTCCGLLIHWHCDAITWASRTGPRLVSRASPTGPSPRSSSPPLITARTTTSHTRQFRPMKSTNPKSGSPARLAWNEAKVNKFI